MMPQTNTAEIPDVEAIMARIRSDVHKLLKDSAASEPAYRPQKLESTSATSPILYSEELNYLNANWQNWATATEITSHRRYIGPLIVKVKKFFVNLTWNYLLKNYFDRERQFQSQLVRFLNATARYVDGRDAEIFWQLIKKIDHDLKNLNDRFDRLNDKTNGTLRTVEAELVKRIAQLEVDREVLTEIADRSYQDITQLDELIHGLERAFIAARNVQVEPSAYLNSRANVVNQNKCKGIDYLLFQNRFRGLEETVRERQRDYLEFFKSAQGDVVDLGCGRGEMLELLRDAGINAHGIDLNEAMVSVCREKGLSAEIADSLDYLTNLPDASLGGLFAAKLVEQLRPEELDQLISLIAVKAKPGSHVIFETINPESVIALSRNFYKDPTHIRPLHPETLRCIMEMKGIKAESILMRSPYPKEEILQPIEVSEHLPERWRQTLEGLNNNVRRLNELLFGFQDFAIVGIVGFQK